MLGRISLLSNDLNIAAEHSDASIRLAETDHARETASLRIYSQPKSRIRR